MCACMRVCLHVCVVISVIVLGKEDFLHVGIL